MKNVMKNEITMPRLRDSRTVRRRILDFGVVLIGTFGLTLMFFLVLPLIQAIAKTKGADTILQNADVATLPPPPPPPEPEPDEPEEEEPEPPEIDDEAPPPDFSQLEMALGDGGTGGFLGSGFSIGADEFGADLAHGDGGFDVGDIDQVPRATYQPSPRMTAKLRKRAPGTVWLLFIVTDKGRVKNPIVQASTDPVFERPALSAIKRWRFEPGKKNGKPVDYRMKLPFTFGKG